MDDRDRDLDYFDHDTDDGWPYDDQDDILSTDFVGLYRIDPFFATRNDEQDQEDEDED